uniref:Uncharacterized protein n=1 Tax=Panagrolaimus sp. JU765 TaxID=591449 RepID=A0AC34RPZ1_9BILA
METPINVQMVPLILESLVQTILFVKIHLVQMQFATTESAVHQPTPTPTHVEMVELPCLIHAHQPQLVKMLLEIGPFVPMEFVVLPILESKVFQKSCYL